MVTVIHPSDKLQRAVNYNHQKEVQGKATCILAVNYPMDPDEMNFHQKLHRLTNQAALRPRTKVNSVHISINFDPSEKLSRPTLEAIAQVYMEKIGFGGQPYLVYEHRDAGHPHLHVVTTNITPDCKRIELHNIGKNQSEKARKAIEGEFDLVRADMKKQEATIPLKTVAIKKVVYGQSETRRAISNVLDAVLEKYKFTSLEELNAVLRQANVQATRGSAASRTFQRGGLLYQVLDEKGKPVGVPIKASSIYSQPTLSNLNKRFEANGVERGGHEKRVKLAIDWYFLKAKQPSPQGLKDALAKEHIIITEYTAKNGQIFGVTYIDHKIGAVFKGSDLGKEYTAKGLETRMTKQSSLAIDEIKPEQKQIPASKPGQPPSKVPADKRQPSSAESSAPATSASCPTEPPMEPLASLPYELRMDPRKKKKKKRQRL
jgi:Relaxase/Mobilisation nuclease domain